MQAVLDDALSPEAFEALWREARAELDDAVAFARSSPSPERDEAFFGAYAGDRDLADPVHRIEERERAAFLPFAPDIGAGSQGGAH
jgi:TPP-dependent pyruvate/acetoin dehydrogenase alpha subunit